jgi:signal transduction histidine kinase
MTSEPIKLLLVEDEPGDARLLQEGLAQATHAQFDITHVKRLSEGIKQVTEAAFDVILLDLYLPDSEGLETLVSMHKHTADAPIIVLTSLNDHWIASEAVQKGAQYYLFKGQVYSNLMACFLRYAIERKKIEEDLRESKRRLEEALAELAETQKLTIQQERLRAMGQMASGIVHDFNNALSPILSISEVLTTFPEMAQDKKRLQSYLNTLSTAAQDAKAVVRRLREFYRHHRDEPFKPVNVNRVIEEVIALTQPKWKDVALGRGVTIRIKMDLKDICPVMGSESELREAIMNLVLNAVDAMDKDGTITLRTYQDSRQVFLEVVDTGTGMSKEVQERCFDIFFTTKNERGTGLGLSMVLGAVEKHSGKIDVESKLGVGTRFTIRLPIPIDYIVKTDTSVASIVPPPLHILVVEDESPIRELIATYLTCDGHTVEAAANGEEGLRKFKKGRFDIVITDKAMPKMNGDEMAFAIKKISPRQPIIMTTGFDDFMLDSGCLPTGVDVVLNKPAGLNDFRQALASVSNGNAECRMKNAE